MIGFAQFSAKKVENSSTFFKFARNTTIENGPILFSREIMSQEKKLLFSTQYPSAVKAYLCPSISIASINNRINNIRTFQSQKLIPQKSVHSLESQKIVPQNLWRKP